MRRAALGQPILFTGRLAAGPNPTNRRSLPVRVRNAPPPLSYVTVSVHQLEPRDVAEAPDWGKGYITDDRDHRQVHRGAGGARLPTSIKPANMKRRPSSTAPVPVSFSPR